MWQLEVSLVDHKELTALLPLDPLTVFPCSTKSYYKDAPDLQGPLFHPHNLLHQKPSSVTSLAAARFRNKQDMAPWVIRCCLLPQIVNTNPPLQLGTILVTTSSWTITAYALPPELLCCVFLCTEAGEGNIYLLIHGGARLQAGTVLSKAINQVILPLTGLSNSSFLSDRLLLHTWGGVEFFSDL